MKFKITIEYEVEAPTQLEAFRKIRDEKQLVYKHIKTKEVTDAIQYVDSRKD